MKNLFLMFFVSLGLIAFLGSIQGYAFVAPSRHGAMPIGWTSQIWSTSTYMGAALERSHELKKSGESVELAKNSYIKALSDAFIPAITFSAINSPYSAYNNPKLDLNKNNTTVNTGLSLNLFNSFKDKTAVDISYIDKGISEINLLLKKQQIALYSLGNYYDILRKKKLLKVVRASKRSYKEQYEKVKRYHKDGMKSLSDLLKSNLNYRNSQLGEIAAIENYKKSMMTFNILLYISPSAEVNISDIDKQYERTLPDIKADIKYALKNRPEMRLAKLALKKSLLDKSKAFLNALPNFSIYANWDKAGIGGIGRAASGITDPTYSINASLSIPLGPETVSDRNNLIASRIKVKENSRYIKLLEFEIEKEIMSEYLSLETALKTHEVSKMKADISKQNLKIVNQKYGEGQSGMIELAEAQGDDLSSQSELANSFYDLLLSRAQYNKTVGINLFQE
ncbi:MAG: TolC family protein [Elusimicrobia bacterium]|nr:TolC family protein [Elusimicrobiota bacterium]